MKLRTVLFLTRDDVLVARAGANENTAAEIVAAARRLSAHGEVSGVVRLDNVDYVLAMRALKVYERQLGRLIVVTPAPLPRAYD